MTRPTLPPRIVVWAIVAATLVAFSPLANNGFISLDDDFYITQNAQVAQGLTWEGVRWAWSGFHLANWHPLTWMSHMTDVSLFGLDPGWHHLSSLVLHLATTIALFAVVARLTGAAGKSAMVAALFALHPLHVESVAWASERKDVLSGLFAALSLAAYLRYVKLRGAGSYALLLVAYFLGLASKPMLVTLPFLLLLLDYWPLGRGARRNAASAPAAPRSPWPALVLEKTPLFLLATGSSIVTYLAQQSGGAVVALESNPFPERVSNALVSYAGYLLKMIAPVRLSVFYPYPRGGHPAWIVAGSLLLLVVLSTAAFRDRARRPYLLVGWLWYLGMLAPVIGILRVGDQAMADRYTYLPLIGLFVAVAWGVPALTARRPHGARAVAAASMLVVLLLSVATWARALQWRDSGALFGHELRVNGGNSLAAVHLARHYLQHGQSDRALELLTAAARAEPSSVTVLYSLGMGYAAKGDHRKAVELLEATANALGDFPSSYYVLQALGVELLELGEPQRAVASLDRVVRAAPKFAQGHLALGRANAALGRDERAVNCFLTALSIDRNLFEAHFYLGVELDLMGRTAGAIEHFAAAAAVQPDSKDAHYNLGNEYLKAGWHERAVGEFQRTVEIDPGHEPALNNLGVAFKLLGRKEEAARAFTRALLVKPDDEQARENLKSISAARVP